MPKLPQESKPETISPYWQTTDGTTVRLYQGNVTEVLRRLPAKSVQMVVTSPPYWALRDYGTAQWEGGDPECDHRMEATGEKKKSFSTQHGMEMQRPAGWAGSSRCSTVKLGSTCKKCGANRTEDHQLGSEPVADCAIGGTAKCGECHVCCMVAVFREIHRVLRDDGTVWMDYGDTYGGGKAGGGVFDKGRTDGRPGDGGKERWKDGHQYEIPAQTGLASGNLMGIPWRVALGMQADGWILRQDIIWHKPSVMPESVRNRCTKSHEYVFLFAKKQGYFYDSEAIREPLTPEQAEVCRRTVEDAAKKKRHEKLDANGQHQVARMDRYAATTEAYAPTSRNKRSVWSIEGDQEVALWLEERYPDILAELLEESGNKSDVWKYASAGYDGAHFATFPQALIEPMIMAGTSERGACAKCGAPWQRIISKTGGQKIEGESDAERDRSFRWSRNGVDSTLDGEIPRTDTIGWQPGCECHGKFIKKKGTETQFGAWSADGIPDKNVHWKKGDVYDQAKQVEVEVEVYVPRIPLADHPIVPCVVLDPFVGSATSCVVSLSLGRRSVGIDLNKKYLDNNAIPRIEGSILSRPALTKLLPRKSGEIKIKGSALRK